MGTTGECIFCGESIELAADGAWQGVDDGACGCTASLERDGDGEHEPMSERAAELCREIAEARRLGRDPQRQLCELDYLNGGA